MTRDEANTEVALITDQYGPYQGVTYANVLKLLGQERYDRLLRDPVRKHGPREGTVYPWNVADYLQYPNLRETHDRKTSDI